MFYKVFLYILVTLAVILTIGLCMTQPKMHTAVLVYDSDYKIVETTKVTPEVKKTTVTPKVTKVQQVAKKVETVPQVQTKQIQKQTVTTQKSTQTTPKEVKKSVQNTVKKQVVPQKTETKIQPKQQTQTTTTTVKQQPVQQVMTSAQEEIEWNKWRSNLQNQIMTDVKLPILPQGTVFKFSFDVDKYGRVTNVQTWSLTPNYTPYAIQHIAPVIRSYQGRSILDFPRGTNRVTTTVTGQWKISTKQKYSTSSNFHDIETVKKGN